MAAILYLDYRGFMPSHKEILKWISIHHKDKMNEPSGLEWARLMYFKEKLELTVWYRQYYLKSFIWTRIRNQVLQRYSKRCYCCNGLADIVHHKRYDDATLKGEVLDYLIPLCYNCHLVIEFDRNRKCSLGEANRRLEILRAKNKCSCGLLVYAIIDDDVLCAGCCNKRSNF